MKETNGLSKQRRAAKGVHPFSGKIFCADCGSPMVRRVTRTGGHEYAYFICGGNKNDKKSCSSHSIKESVVYDTVLAVVQGHIAAAMDMADALTQIDNLAWENRELEKINAKIAFQDEAIVTQEEFDKANEAIQRRRKTARVTHDQSDRVYYCAHCGGKLEKANGTVFACPSHRYHDGSPCEGVYWRKSELEEVLLEALKGQIEITRIESSEVKKAAQVRNESLQRQLVLLKAQYDACGREKFTLYEQYREAKITAEEYLSGKDELTRKQAALKEQLEESEAMYEANQQMSDAASVQQEAVGKMTGLSDGKLREHLYDAVERVLVYDSESIEIVWKFNEVKNGSSSYAGAGL